MKTITIPKPTGQNDLIAKSALVIAIILLPLFMSAQNLTNNSSFNNSSTGWTSSCSVEVNPETTYGGTNASNYVTEIDMDRCIDQNICIMPGATYVLSFRATRRINASTPNNPGIAIKIRGGNTNFNYLNQTKSYNNTTFSWSTETFTFTVPANSSDKSLNLHIQDNNGNSTYGVVMDDIEMHLQTDMAISGNTVAMVNSTNAYSVGNSPSSGITYNWSFGANATPATSTAATPSTKWTAAGSKSVSVVISNSSCLVTTLSTTVMVTGALPLNFTRFTGIIKDNRAAISWSTTNEVNNNYFIVERSLNGRNFDSVGRVQAGNSTSNTYFFNENNTNATSYYRVKQVDINGTYTYSSVITLKNTGSNNEMTVYPTQATSTINYVLSSDAPATVTAQVYTVTGQPVISQQATLQQGLNVRVVDVSTLAKGAYIFKVQVAGTGNNLVKQFSKL
ncbi:MAG: T9SS type A sorting domain-containing protein [Niastella sp.]|uniref:T9SS type A sorting domain-containing protein n=1 Tax=Niastella sp. TaxID=1869183 RepID=UPI003899A31A